MYFECQSSWLLGEITSNLIFVIIAGVWSEFSRGKTLGLRVNFLSFGYWNCNITFRKKSRVYKELIDFQEPNPFCCRSLVHGITRPSSIIPQAESIILQGQVCEGSTRPNFTILSKPNCQFLKQAKQPGGSQIYLMWITKSQEQKKKGQICKLLGRVSNHWIFQGAEFIILLGPSCHLQA